MPLNIVGYSLGNRITSADENWGTEGGHCLPGSALGLLWLIRKWVGYLGLTLKVYSMRDSTYLYAFLLVHIWASVCLCIASCSLRSTTHFQVLQLPVSYYLMFFFFFCIKCENVPDWAPSEQVPSWLLPTAADYGVHYGLSMVCPFRKFTLKLNLHLMY